MSKNTLLRRSFLAGSLGALGAAGISSFQVRAMTPAKSRPRSPNDRLNIAAIGVGGKGFSDVMTCDTENITALCDVDWNSAADAFNRFPHAKRYKDFRKMLEECKEIEAVTISTPDHFHAIAAIRCMEMGKHVYVQKPLSHTVHEARMLRETAHRYGVATQMGNQGAATVQHRELCEMIWASLIGQVREVHSWTDRPQGWWPQGIPSPLPEQPVPNTLDWNLWLASAPYRPYNSGYCPFKWRGWWDFGTGALGDMGAHLMDQPFWALDLGHPKTIQASSTKFTKDSYPVAETVTYEFPARGKFAPTRLTWYDGGLTPTRPKELENGRMMGDEGGGVLIVGKKGSLMCGTYGENPRLLPEKLMQDYKRPAKSIPRSPGIHEEWIAAIKEGKKSTTDFSYSATLTEVMLLGNIAMRTAETKTVLEWDPIKMEFPNLPEANQYLHKQYRQGWSL